jgi:hypothetical protein
VVAVVEVHAEVAVIEDWADILATAWVFFFIGVAVGKFFL